MADGDTEKRLSQALARVATLRRRLDDVSSDADKAINAAYARSEETETENKLLRLRLQQEQDRDGRLGHENERLEGDKMLKLSQRRVRELAEERRLLEAELRAAREGGGCEEAKAELQRQLHASEKATEDLMAEIADLEESGAGMLERSDFLERAYNDLNARYGTQMRSLADDKELVDEQLSKARADFDRSKKESRNVIKYLSGRVTEANMERAEREAAAGGFYDHTRR